MTSFLQSNAPREYMKHLPLWRLSTCLCLLACPFALSTLAQSYKAIATYRLAPGSAAALAVDASSRRVYVAGRQGVAVLNADSGQLLGAVAEITSATDVLIVPVMNGSDRKAATTGFAATSSGVSVFDLLSRRVRWTAQATGVVSMCYDTFTKIVAAVGPDLLASIDPSTGHLIGSAKLHAGDGQIACGTLGRVYVADPDANVVHVLNHITLRNDGDYPMAAGSRPTGLTLDTRGRRLFVSCEDGTVEVVDTDAGFTFTEMHSGSGVAHGVFAWTPQSAGQWKAAAFFTHADGTLTGVRMIAFIKYTLGGEWKITPRARGIVYDAGSHHLLILSSTEDSSDIVVLGD